MPTTIETVLKEALSLKPVERAQLIGELFHSFDKAPDASADLLWAEEAEARLDAHDAGHINSDSAEAVFERINKRWINRFEEKHRQGYLKHPVHKNEFIW
ncbi:MAG: addiction module protein [Deltaproteobacteria bacterium]|nr:addiction module protein [Deltaproteobacteria bacterium]